MKKTSWNRLTKTLNVKLKIHPKDSRFKGRFIINKEIYQSHKKKQVCLKYEIKTIKN